jgi:hypothetical protein
MADASLRLVILEHRWDGVHWDVMVEIPDRPDGPLATWAVDEPIRPDAELPARRLPDHRRVYLEYEGPISGGRGEVRRVAQGNASVREWTEAQVELDVRGDQLEGILSLRRTGAEGSASWVFRFGKLS